MAVTTQVLSAQTVLKSLAGMSAMLLAWIFGAVLWPQIQEIPKLKIELAGINESLRHVENNTKQNRTDINRILTNYKSRQSAGNNSNLRRTGAADINDSIRHINSSGSDINMRSGRVDRLHYVCSKDECSSVSTDWGWSNAGSVHKLYPAIVDDKRLECIDPNKYSDDIYDASGKNL